MFDVVMLHYIRIKIGVVRIACKFGRICRIGTSLVAEYTERFFGV